LTKRHISPEERDRVLAEWGYRRCERGGNARSSRARYFVDETRNEITIRLSHGVSAHSVLGISEDAVPSSAL